MFSNNPVSEVIKPFSWSTQLSMKFQMLISLKISRNSAFLQAQVSIDFLFISMAHHINNLLLIHDHLHLKINYALCFCDCFTSYTSSYPQTSCKVFLVRCLWAEPHDATLPGLVQKSPSRLDFEAGCSVFEKTLFV